MLTQNLPDFWESMYSNSKDYWNFGKPTPALLEFFEHPLAPKSGSVLLPGAAYGYDAEAFAKRGYDVLAVDFCPTAVDALDKLSRNYKNLRSLDLDLFSLSPKDPKKGGQTFDMIYEYGTFSAIHPGRRDEFFEVCYKMMKDDGLLVSLMSPISNESTMQGPPHPTSEGELMARLDGIFDVVERIPVTNSVPGREGKEEFWLLKKVL